METHRAKIPSTERFLSKVLAERRATPSFDGVPIPDDILLEIIKAGAESPSGYNLQPWRFIVVSSVEQKKRLREAAMGQPKVEEAGTVIVCCGDLNAPRGSSLEDILGESVKHGFSEDQNQKMKEIINKSFNVPAGNAMGIAPDYAVWINRHVMIAFTTMMWKAETLGYDTAPMEGFFEDKVKSVLNIPKDVRVVALLGIGKRKGQDKPYAGRRKLRDICFKEQWGVKEPNLDL
jgi:nitroreductase